MAAVQTVFAQGWSELKIKLLPDESFALVEHDGMGRKVRHCPHHDLDGRIDWEQLIYVLGTLDREAWLTAGNARNARQHLEKHYHWFCTNVVDRTLQNRVDINRATLTELVALPTIGPVTAVRILEYRDAFGRFEKVADVQKVDGIGEGVLRAIRHYITVY